MPRAKLSTVSLASLQAEIDRRAGKLVKLIAQRDLLNEQIAELGPQQPAPLAPTPAPKPGKKAKGAVADKTLAQYIHEVLAATEKGLRLKEIEAKVLAAGYPTTAASIYKRITKVLSKGFKRVKRGVYAVETAVKAGKKAAQAAMAPVAKAAAVKKGVFKESAAEMILGLLAGGKPVSTTEIAAAWKKAGRGGKPSKTLSDMVKAKKIEREVLKGIKANNYTLA